MAFGCFPLRASGYEQCVALARWGGAKSVTVYCYRPSIWRIYGRLCRLFLSLTIALLPAKWYPVNCVRAEDGEAAIASIQAHTPNLVVTDIVMPRKNGYELTRWIKNNPATQHIPVVMCTSKSEEFDIYWGMKQGADAYITKPYHPPDLINAVKQLLNL